MGTQLQVADTNKFLSNKPLKIEIVSRISQGEITTADDIVKDYNVSYDLAIAFLNDNQTIQLLQGFTKANTNLLFHTKGVKLLTELLESEDEKTQLSALKVLGSISNNLKSNGADVNVNINLESLIGNSNNLKSINPDIDKIFNEDVIDLPKDQYGK